MRERYDKQACGCTPVESFFLEGSVKDILTIVSKIQTEIITIKNVSVPRRSGCALKNPEKESQNS